MLTMMTMMSRMMTNIDSDGDPRVDFTALAVSYNTIDIRHNSHPHSDESSSDSSTHRRVTRRK